MLKPQPVFPSVFYLDPPRFFSPPFWSPPRILVLTVCHHYYPERYNALLLRVLFHTTKLGHFHAPIAIGGSGSTAHILWGRVLEYTDTLRFLSCSPDRLIPIRERFAYLQVSI